jgi:3',5'-cyclic AMP phosphodiesterase CpdA
MRAGIVTAVVALALAVAVSLGAQAPASAPFFFLQLSDPQFGMFTADKDFAQETINFEMAIATANRLRPAFVVITGDLVNKPRDAAQIAEYRRIAGKLDPGIPLYKMSGNHDIENAPTPESIEAYNRIFGADQYTFRHGSLLGIVLNSTIIHTPKNAPAAYEAQERWLRQQLERAKTSGARHIVIFQHHPWFLRQADEPDEYFNIPTERRASHLALFRQHGVKTLVSGHYHRNSLARDGDMEMVTTGAVGMPLGDGSQSGLRAFIVRDSGLTHRFYSFGEIPNRIDLTDGSR